MTVPAIVLRLAFEARPALTLEGLDGDAPTRLGQWIGSDPAAYRALLAGIEAVVAHAGEPTPPLLIEPAAPQEILTVHGRLFAYADGCSGCETTSALLAAERWATGEDGRCHVWRPGARFALCGARAASGTVPRTHQAQRCNSGDHVSCQRCGTQTWTLAHCRTEA